eukprot:scaffold410166_cov35-Prasinocladus_malaysianus.AAC.1
MAPAIPTGSQATKLSINFLFVDSDPSCRDAANGPYKVVKKSASQAYHCHTLAYTLLYQPSNQSMFIT